MTACKICDSKRRNVSIEHRLHDVQAGGVLVAHFHWNILCHLHWTDLCHLHGLSSRHPDQLQVRSRYHSKHSRWYQCRPADLRPGVLRRKGVPAPPRPSARSAASRARCAAATVSGTQPAPPMVSA